MYAEERQQAIARRVASEGRLSVVEIAERYRVTTETARRDLTALEARGLVRRVHGGAVPASMLTMLEPALVERDTANVDAKTEVAEVALTQLPPAGSSILIDAGSTTARFVDALPADHHLVVYTHSVSVAARLAGNPGVDLHLLPGRVRTPTHAAVGAVTVSAISALRVQVAFLGANGVSLSHGLSTPDSEEAATKRAFVQSADRVVALVDASKFGVETAARFASLDEVDVLVTDSATTAADRKAFGAVGVEVVSR